MLELKKVTKRFKKNCAVDQLSASLQPGVYGLLGPNGASKTTLIRCLTNLYRFQGEILWKGRSIRKNTDYLDRIGYLPQKFGAYQELTVEEMLRYFCVLKRIEKKEWSRESERVLEAVNLTEAAEKKVRHLSGGMLRRLGIAQTLLGKPEVLIFDEPTAGLDPEERLRFKMLISSLSRERIILISTHIVEDVDALCDRILIMDAGRIVFSGTAGELKAQAEGKTFECTELEQKKLTGRFYMERQFEQENAVHYRLVAEEPQVCRKVEPRIEDGYICVLEHI